MFIRWLLLLPLQMYRAHTLGRVLAFLTLGFGVALHAQKAHAERTSPLTINVPNLPKDLAKVDVVDNNLAVQLLDVQLDTPQMDMPKPTIEVHMEAMPTHKPRPASGQVTIGKTAKPLKRGIPKVKPATLKKLAKQKAKPAVVMADDRAVISRINSLASMAPAAGHEESVTTVQAGSFAGVPGHQSFLTYFPVFRPSVMQPMPKAQQMAALAPASGQAKAAQPIKPLAIKPPVIKPTPTAQPLNRLEEEQQIEMIASSLQAGLREEDTPVSKPRQSAQVTEKAMPMTQPETVSSPGTVSPSKKVATIMPWQKAAQKPMEPEPAKPQPIKQVVRPPEPTLDDPQVISATARLAQMFAQPEPIQPAPTKPIAQADPIQPKPQKPQPAKAKQVAHIPPALNDPQVAHAVAQLSQTHAQPKPVTSSLPPQTTHIPPAISDPQVASAAVNFSQAGVPSAPMKPQPVKQIPHTAESTIDDPQVASAAAQLSQTLTQFDPFMADMPQFAQWEMKPPIVQPENKAALVTAKPSISHAVPATVQPVKARDIAKQVAPLPAPMTPQAAPQPIAIANAQVPVAKPFVPQAAPTMAPPAVAASTARQAVPAPRVAPQETVTYATEIARAKALAVKPFVPQTMARQLQPVTPTNVTRQIASPAPVVQPQVAAQPVAMANAQALPTQSFAPQAVPAAVQPVANVVAPPPSAPVAVAQQPVTQPVAIAQQAMPQRLESFETAATAQVAPATMAPQQGMVSQPVAIAKAPAQPVEPFVSRAVPATVQPVKVVDVAARVDEASRLAQKQAVAQSIELAKAQALAALEPASGSTGTPGYATYAEAKATTLSRDSRELLSKVPPRIDSPKIARSKQIDIDRETTSMIAFSEVGTELEAEHESFGMKIELRRPVLDVNMELNRAYDAVVNGQHGMAVEIYDRVLRAQPGNMNALYGKATLLHQAGQIDQARRYYGMILTKDPDHREALNNFLSLVAEESPRDALDELYKLQRKNPHFSPIPAQISNVYQRLGDQQSALNAMQDAYALAPSNLTYALNMAILLDRSGARQQASAYYQQLVDAKMRGAETPGNIDIIEERLSFIRSNR